MKNVSIRYWASLTLFDSLRKGDVEKIMLTVVDFQPGRASIPSIDCGKSRGRDRSSKERRRRSREESSRRRKEIEECIEGVG